MSTGKQIPTKEENPEGLHGRYYIQKVDYSGNIPLLKKVDEDAEYFVLRLDTGGSDIKHIRACRIGIHAYADAIEHHLPKLASDLRERYPLLFIEDREFATMLKEAATQYFKDHPEYGIPKRINPIRVLK